MSAPVTGTLLIRPICARLYRDTQTFGRMDPYLKVKLGTLTLTTKVHKDAGKNPQWNDKYEDQIIIECWDKDTSSADDLVGSTNYHMGSVLKSKRSSEWIEIRYKGKKSGDVKIQFEFFPDKSDVKAPAATAAPSVVYVQQPAPAYAPTYAPPASYPAAATYAPPPAPAPAYPPAYPSAAYPPAAAPSYPPAPGYSPYGPGASSGYPAPAPGGYGAPAPGAYGAPPPGAGYPPAASGYPPQAPSQYPPSGGYPGGAHGGGYYPPPSGY